MSNSTEPVVSASATSSSALTTSSVEQSASSSSSGVAASSSSSVSTSVVNADGLSSSTTPKTDNAGQYVEAERQFLDNLAGAKPYDPIPNEVDDRSIFIGNVDYSTTAEELHRLFSAFGEINRITIRCNRAGHPIGCAYLEYATKESASASLALDETNFKGRELQVKLKRVNVPGLRRGRGSSRPFRSRGRGGRYSGSSGGRMGYAPRGGMYHPYAPAYPTPYMPGYPPY